MDPPTPTPPHPKIKPILFQRFASGRNQNEKHHQKYSISSSKEFKIQHLSQLTRHLPKTLASQHQLSKLQYDFKPQFFPKNAGLPTPITHFFSQMKSLSSLATFNFKVSQSFRFHTRPCLEPLMMGLASLKNLSHLNIIFCNRLSDLELLEVLFKYLKRIKALANLSISFWDLKDLSASHLDVLSLGLGKLHQLHSLELSFDQASELDEEIVNRLTLALLKLRFLTKLGIHFNQESTSSDAILKLFSCFKNIKTLSDLSLALRHEPIKNSKEQISQGLSLLDPSRIRKLKLQSYQRFDDSCLIQFSEALKNFTSLHTLQFGLVISHRSQEEGIAALISTLDSLVSLSSLTIFLGSSHCKKFVEGISVPFKYLKNLKNLELKISGYTYPAFNQEIQNLFSNLRLLKSLRFLTPAYPQKGINDKNLETLGKSLKELTPLQSLSLDFSYAEMLTNHGVEALAHSIKTLHNLLSLKICLKSVGKLDNQAIEQIAKILQGLPCLYSVDLNLLLCPKITCFDELLKALKEAKNIGEVALSLPSLVVKSHEMICIMESKVVKRMTSALN